MAVPSVCSTLGSDAIYSWESVPSKHLIIILISSNVNNEFAKQKDKLGPFLVFKNSPM
jgi:hypothetical protein